MTRTLTCRGVVFSSLVLVTLFILISSSFGTGAYIPEPEWEPVYKPSLAIDRAEGEIDIDGALDDPGWRTAARSRQFVERSPGDMIRPDVETEVLVTYDNKHLYVGFVCYDNPAEIRATMCQRDQFYSDDAVCVLLDTYGDATWAYEFFVNPYGIQKDRLWTSVAGEDGSFDLIWHSAARRTNEGYQVEIAIPFSSMRFPSTEVQEWKMDFWRNRPRESFKQYSWAAYDRSEQCWPCQWGTVNGIGSVEPGKGIELLPSLVANQSGYRSSPGASFDNSDIDGELALGGKYAITSDVTVEAALNPDFSQIEGDAAQIDVNTTIALFYPERRPFFQEGADIFRTLFNSFYTRTVNDPQFATKLTGRMGSMSIGLLTARDENSPYIIPLEEGTVLLNGDKSTVNVLRGSQSFGENSQVGFMLTDRRYDGGGYGSIFSTDGAFRLTRNYSIVGQVVASYTREPEDRAGTAFLEGADFSDGKYTSVLDGEKYWGAAFISQFRRRGRHLNFTVNFDQVAPSYRTQTGYDPWNDYRNAYVNSSYTFYTDEGFVETVTPQAHWDRRWNFDGDIKWTHLNAGTQMRFRFHQMYAGINYTASSEQWYGREYDDLWQVEFYNGARLSDAIGYDLNVRNGRGVAIRAGAIGNEISFRGSLDLKPIDRLIIEPNVEYARSTHKDTGTELYEQFITRTRLRYQATTELSLRLVVQYNNASETWDVDPMLTYRLSPFSVFYIGSTYDYANLNETPDGPTDWRLARRQFFMKIQYLFQT